MQTTNTEFNIKRGDKMKEYLEELAELDKKGLLVRLPCKVGEDVWIIYNNNIAIGNVMMIYIDEKGMLIDVRINTVDNTTPCIKKYCLPDEMYCTKEAAEQALKQWRCKNGY